VVRLPFLYYLIDVMPSSAATLQDRPREGRHSHCDRCGGQRPLGYVRSGAPEAPLEAHRRHDSGMYAALRRVIVFFFLLQTCPPDPQEELVKSATFRYITDAITPDEALAMLKAKEATKNEREVIVRSQG